MAELLSFTRALPTELFALRIALEDGRITARVDSTRYPDLTDIQMDTQLSRQFMMALDRVGIQRWERSHVDPFGPGGEVWTLTYRRPGEPDVVVEGDRAHPDNWEEFLKVVDMLVPQSAPRPIDLITLAVSRDVTVLDGEGHPLTQPYEQLLTIRRHPGSITVTRTEAGDHAYTLRLKLKRAVGHFLDSCALMFRRQLWMPSADATGAASFKLTVRRRGQPEDVWSGVYARNVLPPEWPVFMERFREFLGFYANPGEMFDEDAYGHGARPGELIYLTVHVGKLNRALSYRTEDDTIRSGDRVLVPLGKENHPVEGRVSSVGYYTPDEVPWPLDETKMVLRVMRGENKKDTPEAD